MLFPSQKAGKKEAVKTLAAFYRVPLGNTFWTILIFTPEKEVFAKLTSFRNRLYHPYFTHYCCNEHLLLSLHKSQ